MLSKTLDNCSSDQKDLVEKELELTEKVLQAKTLPIVQNYKKENISAVSQTDLGEKPKAVAM